MQPVNSCYSLISTKNYLKQQIHLLLAQEKRTDALIDERITESAIYRRSQISELMQVHLPPELRDMVYNFLSQDEKDTVRIPKERTSPPYGDLRGINTATFTR